MALRPFAIAHHVIWFLCDLCALGGESFLIRPGADAHQSRAEEAPDPKLEN
jgi:hypothetical protein